MSEKTNSFNYNSRWRPDFRYTDNKHENISVELFKSTEPSVTDKEAYRLTLASLRGQMAQGSGRPDVGSLIFYLINKIYPYRKDENLQELEQ